LDQEAFEEISKGLFNTPPKLKTLFHDMVRAQFIPTAEAYKAMILDNLKNRTKAKQLLANGLQHHANSAELASLAAHIDTFSL